MSIKETYLKFVGYHREYPLLYLGAVLCLVLPFLSPIGLPLPIGEHARNMYNWIEAQPPGLGYLFNSGYDPSLYPECGYLTEANVIHILKKGGSALIYIMAEAGMLSANIYMPVIQKDAQALGKTYGEDWIHMGLVGRAQPAEYVALATNLWFAGIDYYGTYFGDIPITKKFSDANDIAAHFFYGAGSGDSEVRFFGEPYNMPILYGSTACGVPGKMAFYPKYAVAVINSITGSAEYMNLSGDLRWPVKTVDVISLCLMIACAYIVIGNITYFMGKSKRGET
jgi:hypothetical protein